MSMLLVTNSMFSDPGPSTRSRQVCCHFLERIASRGPSIRVVVVTKGRSSTTHLRTPGPLLRGVGIAIHNIIHHGTRNSVSLRRLVIPLCARKRIATCYLTIPCLHRKSCPSIRGCSGKIRLLCRRLFGRIGRGKIPIVTVKRLRTANSRVSRSSHSRHAIVKNLRYMSPSTFSRTVTCATLKRLRHSRHMSRQRGIHCSKAPVPVSFTREGGTSKIIVVAVDTRNANVRELTFRPLTNIVDVPHRTHPLRRILRTVNSLPSKSIALQSPCLRVGVLVARPRPSCGCGVRRTLGKGTIHLTHVTTVLPRGGTDNVITASCRRLRAVHPLSVTLSIFGQGCKKARVPSAVGRLLRDMVGRTKM